MFYNTTGTQAVPYIAELNTNTWIWSIPNVSKTNAPPSLSFHSAAIYGDYMFIAFATLNDYINSALLTGICVGIGIIVLGLLLFGFLLFKK
ncbi:19180_t:CDS:2 [Gigaspora margarita]|uniref:19180_t:CDS:1 n=1 Tax=Gigaspora margarita TaxID=4874 RepID=A0ABM8W3H8_GIGMA|nr:19180_t:CDS:2 [Gigaspora margarita]